MDDAGERQAILAQRQARDEADRQENEARVQAIQAEIDEEKRREAEKDVARDSWGNPIYYGWVVGPGFWPSQPWPQNPAGSP